MKIGAELLNVLLIGFNRPYFVNALVSQLQHLQDTNFWIAVDGPRHGRTVDADLVRETIQEFERLPDNRIANRRYLGENLGCGQAVASAIDWFFDQVDEGVILEDDCVPTPQFWDFMREALSRFSKDDNVGVISGVCYVPPHIFPYGTPFYLSRYPYLWGWATWKPVWNDYQLTSGVDKRLRLSHSWQELSFMEKRDWREMIGSSIRPPHHTWDYQFVAHLWRKNLKAINPTTPLVSNIGMELGTHAGGRPDWIVDADAMSLSEFQSFSDSYPKGGLTRVEEADEWWSRNVVSPPLRSRLARRFKFSHLSRLLKF